MGKIKRTAATLAIAAGLTMGAGVAPVEAAPTAAAVSVEAAAGSFVTAGRRCHWVINWWGLFTGTANQQWVLRCYWGE